MKKLSISLDNDSDDVNYYILEAFPKLKGAGGYELGLQQPSAGAHT